MTARTVAERPSRVGQPAKVALALKLVVTRSAAEPLTTRAIREQ